MLLADLVKECRSKTLPEFTGKYVLPALLFSSDEVNLHDVKYDPTQTVPPPATLIEETDDAIAVNHGEAADRQRLPDAIFEQTGHIDHGRCIKASSSVTFIEKSARNYLHGFITVGRAGSNDIIVNDRRVSAAHAVFVPPTVARPWTILDQNSRNGTIVNAARIKPQRPTTLKDGDKIIFGEAILATFCMPHGLWRLIEHHRLKLGSG